LKLEDILENRHFELGFVGADPNPKQKSIWDWIKNLIIYILV